MLSVVAPHSIAVLKTSIRKGTSERLASSAENSTSSISDFARLTPLLTSASTPSLSSLSLYSMCMGLVAMNVCIRGRSASFTASAALLISSALVLASPAIIGPFISRAIACTDSKSPGDEAGKPASMTSTPSRASWRAICSFSPLFRLILAACSPSLSVVSKIRTRSIMSFSPLLR